MSNQQISKKAKWYMILSAIFMPLFLIVPSAYYILKGNSDSGKGDDIVIHEESLLKPIGQLVRASEEEIVAKAPNKEKEFSAEKTYNGICAACHASGVLGSPKFHDKDAWDERINVAGFDDMVSKAIEGIGQMPAKGGATDITDEQFKEVVHYLVGE